MSSKNAQINTLNKIIKIQGQQIKQFQSIHFQHIENQHLRHKFSLLDQELSLLKSTIEKLFPKIFDDDDIRS